MKKTLTRILSIVMISALLLSLTACGGKFNSMKELADSKEIQDMVTSMSSSLDEGMALAITGEDNKLIYTFTLPDELVVDGMAELLQSGVEAQASTFEDLAKEMQGKVNVENPVVVVTYVDSQGNEIYSQEFAAPADAK